MECFASRHFLINSARRNVTRSDAKKKACRNSYCYVTVQAVRNQKILRHHSFSFEVPFQNQPKIFASPLFHCKSYFLNQNICAIYQRVVIRTEAPIIQRPFWKFLAKLLQQKLHENIDYLIREEHYVRYDTKNEVSMSSVLCNNWPRKRQPNAV